MRTIDVIRDTKIDSIIQESSNIRSFFFKDEPSLKASPGQFVMVWLPGAGEFPMSLSLPSKRGLASIGVKAMGTGSKALYESKVGDFIGIRGPYGTSFELGSNKGKPMRRVLLVGGGTGMVPMIVLAKALSKISISTTLVVGARTKEELPYLGISKKIIGAKNVFATTDDGTYGFKGLAHEQVQKLVAKYGFDEIFSCGPEKMMAQVFGIAKENQIPVQFSLERIMKCGIGICGSCTIGPMVLCKEGAILNEKDLDTLRSEFGLFHRDKAGTLRPI
ncbi:MAG: dihydroorotate dehydrogenase electron transfer subunit [archaeon]|nr:dihydroorotate dehydrogenase electron transfer subunit [archaeon]